MDLYLEGAGACNFIERVILLETLKTNTGSLSEIKFAFEDVLSGPLLNFHERDKTISVGRKVSGMTKPLSSAG